MLLGLDFLPVPMVTGEVDEETDAAPRLSW